MGKKPEDWTEEEVQRFFARLQSEGGSAEDVAMLKRLLEKRVAGESVSCSSCTENELRRRRVHQEIRPNTRRSTALASTSKQRPWLRTIRSGCHESILSSAALVLRL
jgi:hypothetical protein